MVGIAAPGVGSGLDVNSIVSQLVALERRPLGLLETQKADYESQLSAMGRLRSALDSFESAMDALGSLDKFSVYTATSADEEAFTATASSSASVGELAVRVVNLATSHRLGSGSVADTDTSAIGSAGDQMTVTVDGQSFTIDIGGLTLAEVRDAINEASDNVGVTATILSENDSSYRLILNSDASGTANAMSLAFTNGGSPITDPLSMTETVAAEDAQLLVDNTYTITRSSNTIDDAIQGVTLNLLAETAGSVELSVNRDLDAVEESVQAFADAYNALRSTIDDLRAGQLAGDNTLLSIERQLRDVLNNPPAGASSGFEYLSQIGVSIQKDGSMSVSSGDLRASLERDFTAVANLFAAEDQGYAYRLESVATGLLQTQGLIDAREDGLQKRIDDVTDRQLELERRLVTVEERYRTQFAALDSLLSQLNTTSTYLTQQLATLPSNNTNGG